MDETTSSTNVDSNKKDKCLEDLKRGTPSVNGFCEYVKDKGDQYEIVVDPESARMIATNEVAREIVSATRNNDARILPASIAVHTVSREELEKIKTILKARQAAQEKAREAEKENADQEK